MSYSKTKKINKIFNKLYKNTCYIEQKLAIIDLKASLKHLLQNPNEDDYKYIRNRIAQLSKELDELENSYRNVNMACGRFLRLPKEIEVVNEEEASFCDDAVAVQVLHGSRLNLPTRIYFFRKCEKDSHFKDNLEFFLGEKYPAFKTALEVERIQRRLGFRGSHENLIMSGVFPLHESIQFYKHLDECFENGTKPTGFNPTCNIGIYRQSDLDETANL